MTQHLRCDNTKESKDRDVVYTPAHVVSEMVGRYNLAGKILDPCAGDEAFSGRIPGCLWCEIKNGRDFFDWKEPVDWIIGNPPYSILNAWLEHSFSLANDVVYLLPIAKVFGSRKRLLMIKEYGGIVEVYAPWTGRAVGFAFGWACGAVYFRKNYTGQMSLVV